MIFYSLNKTEKRKITDDFMYAYSPVCKSFGEFVFEDDCIRNSFNAGTGNWDYISIVTKKKYTSDTTVIAKCSLENGGAPIIMLTSDVAEENGKHLYSHYYEVVLYENGINIWCVEPYPERVERPIKATKIGFLGVPVKTDTKLELQVTVEKKMITVKMYNYILKATDINIPENFHIGITSEGKIKFYEFVIA